MKKYLFVYVFILAVFFRFYNLSQVPSSASLDEASIGYNAYSILKTGRDEYGSVFPLLLRAYDDYRPALYVYLVAPFIGLFGLSAFSVRLPSVILSLFTVYLVFLMGKMIGKKYLSFGYLGEISAGVLSISPWHIYISRLGHEANLGLTLYVLGVYFFLEAVILNKKYPWIFSAISFGLSVHGYQSEKIVSPLLVIIGAVLFWRDFWKAKKYVFVAAIIGFFIVVPAFAATISPEGMARFRGTSAFVPNQPKVLYIAVFVRNYVSHFSPFWLFFGTDREVHKVPGLGLLYVWESLFVAIGMWALWKSKIPKNISGFISLAVLLAPLPGAITTQAPHAMRAYTMIPALQLTEAIGIWFLCSRLKKSHVFFFGVVLGIMILLSMSLLWKGYFVRFPKEQSDSFQYAIKPAIVYALEHENAYQRIEFSHQGALYQSYMFYLFYSRLDPRDYVAQGGTKSGGFASTHYIGKYAFGFIPENLKDVRTNTLYFYDALHVPAGLRILKTFSNLDGQPAITAATL